MKLRNKKTGEIVNAMEVDLYTDVVYLKISKDGRYDSREYDSLAEFSEDWEDYEEPKDDAMRVIDSFIQYVEEADDSFCCDESVQKFIDKLKAWERLKDKGFRFEGWYGGSRTIHFRIDSLDKEGDCLPHFVDDDMTNDLDLLFGGEE